MKMKMNILAFGLISSLLFAQQSCAISVGDPVKVSYISRNIDNGEHKFDENNNIIYNPFAICRETGKPLELRFMKDEKINCTISLVDEQFHLFQMYIHEDVPWSCRLTVGSDDEHVKENLGSDGLDLDDDEDHGAVKTTSYNVSVPFIMNAELHESHLRIDPRINILLVANEDEDGSFRLKSGVGFGNGDPKARKRYVIDDDVNFEFNVFWQKSPQSNAGVKDIFYACFMTLLVTLSILGLAFFGFISRRKKIDYSKLE